jgi:hypothetical protein
MSDESSGPQTDVERLADPADVAVAQALASAGRVGGPQLPSDPRRVQGMVNDVLGAESRTRRAEVDAVVLAAEESIPDDLMSGRIDVAEAIERLHVRGLDGAVALFAVDVWRYALGMLGQHSVPPTLSSSMEARSQPAITDSTPASLTESEPDGMQADVSEATRESQPVHWAPPGSADDAGLAVVAGDSHRSKSWWIVGSAAALVAVLVVALVVMATGGDENSDDAAATTAPAVTTSVSSTTSTAPVPQAVRFDSEVTAVGDVERSWEMGSDTVEATLVFTNTTDAATSGTHYEVLPTSMAPSSASISSPTEFVVLEDVSPQGLMRTPEPATGYVVLAWNLVVEPATTAEVNYSVAVPPGTETSADTLEVWRTEQVAAAAAFAIERETPPTLTVTTPNGTVFQTQRVEITGTTDPAATLTLNGNPVTVNPDGTWIMSGDLAPGPSTLDFVAVNRYGTAASASVSVTIELPLAPTPNTSPGPTTTQATTKPGTPSTGTVAPPTTAPPTTAPPTTAPPTTAPPPPANQAPVKAFDPTFTTSGACDLVLDYWTIYVLQAFSDPDGDPLQVTGVSTGTGSASSTGSAVKWTEPYPEFAGTAVVSFSVTDGRGGTTGGRLTITAPPGSRSC